MLHTERETEKRLCISHPTASHLNSFKMSTDVENRLAVAGGEEWDWEFGISRGQAIIHRIDKQTTRSSCIAQGAIVNVL